LKHIKQKIQKNKNKVERLILLKLLNSKINNRKTNIPKIDEIKDGFLNTYIEIELLKSMIV